MPLSVIIIPHTPLLQGNHFPIKAYLGSPGQSPVTLNNLCCSSSEMIEFLRPTPAGLVELEGPEKNCWISLSSPSEEDLARLKEIIAIPDETLHTLKDIDEIPIVEKEEGYTFFIIRTPYNNVKNDLEYSTVPLGVFVTEDYTVTISYFVNDTVPRMKELKFPFRGKLFVFRLLLVSARIYLTYLKEIHRMMFFLEEKLEETQKNIIL